MAAQRWEEAAQAFDRAIEGEPREDRARRLYGMHYGYFPHRKKGIALYQLGRWEEAVQALQESLRQGASEETERYLEFARNRQPMVELPRIFRGTWWDYYDRGLLYSERGLWKSAIEDFRAALKRRDQEDRSARTYGVRFIEYFPLRELGVALYQDGQVKAAVEALGRSLAAAPTAKTAYYFNLARAALLRQTAPDRNPPRLKIEAPNDGLLTNLAAVEVRGTVESRNLVSGVEINGEPLLIEPAVPTFAFAQTVSLVPGENVIEVVARDLVATEAKVTVKVMVDREGPVVVIDRLVPTAAGLLRLEGTIYDNVRLGSLQINGQAISLSGVAESTFSAEVLGGPSPILIEAADAAGNITRVRFPIPSELRPPRTKYRPPVVPVSWAPMTALIVAARESLAVELEPIAAEVQQDTISMGWTVTAAAPLMSMKINEEVKTVRPLQAGRAQSYSHLLTLHEGENVFTITVADETGETVTKTVKVVRKVDEVEQIGSRLSVAVMPFEHKGKRSELYEAAYDATENDLVNQQRFKIVSRVQLENILKEQRLSQTNLVDRATAIRVGRLAAAEAILLGAVTETAQEAQIYVELVNTETGTVLVAKDTFDPVKSRASFREKVDELVKKVKADYPLVGGSVVDIRHGRLAVNLGSQKRVRDDMKVIVYLEGDPLIDPQTKIVLGRTTEVLGEGLLRNVRPLLSYCVVPGEDLRRIKPLVAQHKSLKVITK